MALRDEQDDEDNEGIVQVYVDVCDRRMSHDVSLLNSEWTSEGRRPGTKLNIWM